MAHRNFCNHSLITNVALGIFMTMRANKNLFSRHIRTLSLKKHFKILYLKCIYKIDICNMKRNKSVFCNDVFVYVSVISQNVRSLPQGVPSLPTLSRLFPKKFIYCLVNNFLFNVVCHLWLI